MSARVQGSIACDSCFPGRSLTAAASPELEECVSDRSTTRSWASVINCYEVRTTLASLALLLSLSSASVAYAEPEAGPKALSIFSEIGPGAPFGWIAMGLVARPMPWWSLMGGGGYGLGGG